MTAMPSKQKIIDLIVQSRGRSIHSNSTTEALFRTGDLRREFEKHKGAKTEALRYFLVASIALLESFFRAAIKEVIDADLKYAKNAEKISKDLKFNLDAILAFQGKQITIGEFIAHNLPFSRIEHLNALSELLDSDFLKALKNVHNRWEHEVEGKAKQPIIGNPDETFANVQRALEIRHEICHEWATRVSWDETDIERCFNSTLIFVDACYQLIAETLSPGHALTQSDMTAEAGGRFTSASKELEKLNTEILAYLGANRDDRLKDFKATMVTWESYMKTWADFEANEHAGGSMAPMIYYSAAETVILARVEQLKNLLEIWLAEEL